MLSTRPKLQFLILTMALCLPGLLPGPAWSAGKPSQEKFSFTILHSNDLHSHEDNFLEHGKNLGGLPRIAYLIKTAKKNNPRVLAIDAGDIFQGTAFFEQYKGETDVQCLNMAGYDIYTIGNHEFDEGPANLGKQLKLAKFDVISCNLDVSSEANLKEVVKPSVVKEIDGEKIGFIGVITPALKELAPKLGELKLISPGPHWMEPVREEIEKLKKQGINKIVLVSHCGVDLERLLAALDGVDVVVGGHSHTRLDDAIIVSHPDGSDAMVVQTGCYGRALGRMDLVFDKEGKLIVSESKYRLTNITDKVFEDPEVKAFVTEKAKPFEYLTKTILATAEMNFDNRFKAYPWDSPIGDLVCDALFDAAIEHGATISMQNRGGIRGGLDQGQISLEDVREILPFQNKLVVATVTGKTLLGALEHSAASVGGTGGPFLDVHGLKYGWDPTLELGHRIVFDYAQNKEGVYEPIVPDDLYRIAVNDYTFGGGEGYDFKDAKDVVSTGKRLSAVVEEYLKKVKQVKPALPNRFLRVSSNIAKKVGEGANEKIEIDYPTTNAEISVLTGSAQGVSFVPKIGTVPLVDPQLVSKTKVEGGSLTAKVSDLLGKGGGKKGDQVKLFAAVVLTSRDADGTSTRIVSVPIQLR